MPTPDPAASNAADDGGRAADRLDGGRTIGNGPAWVWQDFLVGRGAVFGVVDKVGVGVVDDVVEVGFGGRFDYVAALALREAAYALG